MNIALTFFSAISFLVYGACCFTSPYLHREFERYGFSNQRMLIGFLEICGAIGLGAGLWIPLFGATAAGGLALLMLCGIGVRVKIRDGFLQTFPAILYFIVNTYLAFFGF